MPKIDIICFGSATEDIFVKIHPKMLGKNLCFYPGAKIEIEEIGCFSGGGAANTAVGFSRLGLKTGIVTVIGPDLEGKQILSELKKEKVNTFGAFKDKKAKTSRSVILTGFGKDRVVLNYSKALNALAQKHIDWQKLESKWFYISSLHKKPALFKKLVGFAHKNKIKVALNPGAIEIAGGVNPLLAVLKKTSALILNAEEARALAGHKTIRQNLAELSRFAKIVAITSGESGSFAQSGSEIFFQKAIKTKIADVTGAGDAFACAFTASIIKGKKINYALKAGTANAASVIKYLGAKNVLLTGKQLDPAVKKLGKQ